MDCSCARAALSARIDGEDAVADRAAVDRHVAGCAACTAWYGAAVRLDRLVRVSPASDPQPNPVDFAPVQAAGRRRRWRLALLIALLVDGFAQLTIGAISLFTPLGMPAGMGASQHMDHEVASFNLAFGVILVLMGLNSRRARTQVPVLASFVGVLAVASTVDLLDGNVDWTRLATHLPVVVGLGLALVISRARLGRRDPGKFVAVPSRGRPHRTPTQVATVADRPGSTDQLPATMRKAA